MDNNTDIHNVGNEVTAEEDNPTQTRVALEVDSGVFAPIVTIDQYSYLYIYYDAVKDTYDVCREVEYMNFDTEPFWWENLTQAEAEAIIKENQEKIVAVDSVLKRESIWREKHE